MPKIRIQGTVDSNIVTPPAGKASMFYNNVEKVMKLRLDDGSLILLSVSEEYVQDVVGSFFQDSSTINVTYNDAGDIISIDVVLSALDISQIPNVPSGNLTSTNVQAALNELQTHIDNVISGATEAAQDAIGSAIAAGTQNGITVTYNDVSNSIDFTNIDKGSVAVTAHEAALDPHPQYETATEVQAKVDAHANLTNNPHSVTKSQVGLGLVDNTSDMDKPVSTAQATAIGVVNTALSNHITDAVDAHDASAISVVPTGNLSSTDTQSALVELQTDIDNILTNAEEVAQDAIAAAISAGTQDGISVTYNDVSNSISFTNTDKGTVAVTTHEAASNPHPQYTQPTDAPFINPQVVRVKLSDPAFNEFTDLALAVASITDADPVTKPYIIEMGAGNFAVSNPIILPSGVSIRGEGINTTSISPINANQHLLVLGTLSEVAFLNLKGTVGSIGSGKAAIYCEDVGEFGQVHKVSIYDFDIGVDNLATTATSIVYCEYVDINGDYSFAVRNRAENGQDATLQAENFYTYASAGTNPVHIYSTGTTATIVVNSIGLQGGADNKGIVISDGSTATVSDAFVKNFSGTTGEGFVSENTGAGPFVEAVSVSFYGNTKDISIDNPATTGSINTTADKTKVTIDDAAVITILLADAVTGGVTFTGELNYSSDNFSNIADIGPLVSTSSTMGVFTGGQLSAGSGLTLNVAALKGYISLGTPPTDTIKYFQLASQTISTPANSNLYTYINSSGILVQNSASPDTKENILLGRVVTNATDIIFIEKSPLDSQHYSNKIDRVFREAIGSIYATGSLVSENGTRGLDVTAGEYYYSETEFLPAGGTAISWSSFYESSTPGVYTRVTGVTTVDKDFYDDGTGTLASIPSGKHVKHLLMVLGGPSEQYSLVYATDYYNTLAEAQAAPLPVVPNFMNGAFARVASVIVGPSSTNILDIIDERPRVGFASSSSVGGITDHGVLSGLGDNDHDQYLLRSGLNVMVGNFDMGGNSITNVNLVDGIDVTAHSSRHAFNGADPFLSATPQTVGTANAEGTSNTQFSRADHVHAHGNQTGPTQHAVATTSANGFMSSTDKTKLDGISGTRIFKSGTVAAVSFTGAPRKATVTFATAMPNTNYSITGMGANSRSWSFESKTVNGFVINANANAALSGEFTWQCMSHGETVE